jgi:hypothetical protein
MSRESWPVWIKASVAAYFKAAEDGITFILEEEELPVVDLPRVELRLDGPDIQEHKQDEVTINVYLNLLLITQRDQNDLYDHDKLLGKLINAMTTSINVIQTTNGGAFFGCLIATDGITVTRYGEIDKAPELIQSTVERSYKITL